MTIRFAFPRAVAAAVTGLFLAGSFHQAEAHISYSGRDFGTVTTGSTISGQAVSSSFGWADATDSNWGDSHRMRAYRFTLSEPTSVTITAQRQNLLTGTATGQQTGGHDVLLPGSVLPEIGTDDLDRPAPRASRRLASRLNPGPFRRRGGRILPPALRVPSPPPRAGWFPPQHPARPALHG